MTENEFEAECKRRCIHCQAGEKVRQRMSTKEWVHDFSFGAQDPKIGRRVGQGHSICAAHAFREANKDQVA